MLIYYTNKSLIIFLSPSTVIELLFTNNAFLICIPLCGFLGDLSSSYIDLSINFLLLSIFCLFCLLFSFKLFLALKKGFMLEFKQ